MIGGMLIQGLTSQRLSLAAVALFVLCAAPPAHGQSTAVCETFTDAEVTDLLGKPPTVKRTILGAESDCVWGITGLSLMVNRFEQEPETVTQMVDSELKNPRPGDTVAPEPTLGAHAVSTLGQYGRSATLLVASGKVFWKFHLEKIDQKLDTAVALPKMRALAKKAIGVK